MGKAVGAGVVSVNGSGPAREVLAPRQWPVNDTRTFGLGNFEPLG